MLDDVLRILPPHMHVYIQTLSKEQLHSLEEIRVRVHRPLELLFARTPFYPPYKVTVEDGQFLLNQLSEYSLYAFEEELRRGYITIQGGHRVGLAGKAVLEKGYVQTLRSISSFNIRIARQKKGAAERVIADLYDQRTGWQNTLFVGPPQTGKTTILRDLSRYISEGIKEKRIVSRKVGIVDERSEIAACVAGIPQHDLGYRVDVLDSCPKAEGMMMMIRSMSPDVLVVDEIGRQADVAAILEAMHAGVVVIATAHGESYEQIMKRPTFSTLFRAQAFDRVVELEREPHPGTVKRIRLPKQLKERVGR